VATPVRFRQRPDPYCFRKRDLANATIDRNRLDRSDVADNSKTHTPALFQRIIIRDTDSVSRQHCTTAVAAEANAFGRATVYRDCEPDIK
jgi:hypothetical protein